MQREKSQLDQLRDYADDRLIFGCIYCGGPEETREHVPSKVFLDSPFPEQLPVVSACRSCNNGFSLDEEYLACLVEAVVAGSADPARIRRPRVAGILRHTSALRTRIEATRSSEDGQIRFAIEPERVRNVLVKLAIGHAAFELSQPCRHEPASVWWQPLASMSEEQQDEFEASQVVDLLGEIGSRGSQRLHVVQLTFRSDSGETRTKDLRVNEWVEVQEGLYRYHAADYGDMVRIKLVIGDYLACAVEWGMD